jgi:hypothetical protein
MKRSSAVLLAVALLLGFLSAGPARVFGAEEGSDAEAVIQEAL